MMVMMISGVPRVASLVGQKKGVAEGEKGVDPGG